MTPQTRSAAAAVTRPRTAGHDPAARTARRDASGAPTLAAPSAKAA